MSRHQRKVRNYLINPVVQLRLSAICIGLILIFSIAVLGLAYFSVVDLFETLIELSDMQNEVRQVVASEISKFGSWLVILLVAYSLITTAVIIMESHRVVGAAYAINRFLEEKLLKGDFSSRVHLRKGDFLQDVAQSLNELAENIQKSDSPADKGPQN